MEFGLSQDQKMMQDSVHRTLERAAPLARVREAAEANAIARDVHKALADLGVTGLLIPESFGGAGLKLLDAALVSETLGRHAAPVPFIAASVMAPLALIHAGSPEQQQRVLPKLAAGETIAGVAIAESVSGTRDGAGLTASGGKLNGKALFVMDFADADLFVVADRACGLHMVEANAPGLTKTSLISIDRTRTLGEIACNNTPAEPLQNGNAAEVLSRMRDAGWVMLAADTLGAGWHMIDQAVAYAKERKQFDRVIGSFQAVKHMCAEMAAELEPCRSLVWYAAHAFDAIPADAALTAAHAKAHTSEIGRFVARTATEVHGGMGMTDLLGLHYWFKRIGLNRQLLGGPERVRDLAAAMQGFAAAS
ncbi:MAG: acyl-CoA/acyl-ACP dehydrogenase [Alphaproteobacteria bacterium]|nr:acyl-CoA/acyl-ACP dehydrogenase [Alphaproteobacteria bacterium]